MTEVLAAPTVDHLEDLSFDTRGGAGRAALGRLRGGALRASVVVAVLGAWLALGEAGRLDERTFPPLPSVLSALVDLVGSGRLAEALPVSLGRAAIGFGIGAGVTLVLGLLAGLSRIGEELFDAPMQVFRAIPFFALLPLFVTWFGIEEASKIALIVCAVVPPVYINTYSGARNVDARLIEAARAMRMSSYTIAARLILPTAMPSIITGLRYASSIALLALVIAEQLNSQAGLGFIMTMANRQSQLDIVVAVVVVYAVLGLLLDLFWRAVEALVLPWRGRTVD